MLEEGQGKIVVRTVFAARIDEKTASRMPLLCSSVNSYYLFEQLRLVCM